MIDSDFDYIELEKIQRRLKEDFGVNSTVIRDGTIIGHSNLITVLVRAPQGNDRMWLLRMAPDASFDRWANSMCIEERFDSGPMLRTYFYLHQTDVWRQLFSTLSEEYLELNDTLQNLSIYTEG